MKKLLVRILCLFIPSRKKRHKIREKFLGKPVVPEPQPAWMGRHSYIGYPYSRMHPDTTVGAFCSIGRNVSLGPAQHPTDWLSSSPFQYEDASKIVENQKFYDFKFEPVTVGNDVWIGNNVIIMDGVKIADGCIIGSNAVVTHDTEPYSIVVGVPAKIIKYRFAPGIIKDLLKLKWWELPDEQIATLPFNDIKKCIQELKKIRKG